MTSPPVAPELTNVTETPTAVIRGVVPMNELANFFDRSFTTLATVAVDQNVAIAGPAYALYHAVPTDTADLEVGFPVSGPIEPTDGVEAGSLPAGRVARAIHQGGYDQLGSSWGQLEQWIRDQGLEPTTPLWEVYVTEPRPDMDPDELRTELNWPVTG
jgi:effector-binding domain-containing protein